FSHAKAVYMLIEQALEHYPTLQPKIAEHIEEEGVRQALLCLHGTLPVVFNGATFNIPVVFWFPRAFPEHSPMAYVTPTRSMVVKVGKHVDVHGRVYHPYLAAWSMRSTLCELFATLIQVFSVEPPVFSRPPGYTGASYLGSRPNTASTQFLAQQVGSASTLSLPHSTATMPSASIPNMGAMSMSSLPQISGAPGFMPSPRPTGTGSLPSAFGRPVSSYAEAEHVPAVSHVQQPAPSTVNASAVPVEQSLSQMTLKPTSSSSSEQPAESAQASSYTFNPVSGRPPVPTMPSQPPPQSPTAASEHAALGNSSSSPPPPGSPTNQSNCANNRVSVTEPEQLPTSNSVQPQSPALQEAGSPATIAAATTTAAASATLSAAENITPTTAVSPLAAQPGRAKAESSLMDTEPMDDPQKRLVGYQLAILDRVTEAVKKSREKDTRVNKELLDQSANLNSGAGVIAEERRQLLESQRQLSANISVLEHKLNELNEKKAEFPDASRISDVRRVFCGQTPAMEQLFDLAGEIAAIDDTLYFLGRALNDGRLSLAIYMRQVRKLAQQQFMAKALALKIRRLCGLK
ncbi:suppressor protein stp22 of temperature-sensitive alpha-factor receptor and arginine permease, partial [Coemansia sp. RSA 990]